MGLAEERGIGQGLELHLGVYLPEELELKLKLKLRVQQANEAKTLIKIMKS